MLRTLCLLLSLSACSQTLPPSPWQREAELGLQARERAEVHRVEGLAELAAAQYRIARAHLEAACDEGHGDGEACSAWSYLVLNGFGGPEDPQEATRLRHRAALAFERECAVGEAAACRKLALRHHNVGHEAAAAELYQRACALDPVPEDCERAQRSPQDRISGAQQARLARARLRCAREPNDEDCNAVIGFESWVDRVDEGRDGCRRLDAAACAEVARAYAQLEDDDESAQVATAFFDKAILLWDDGCRRGKGAGCAGLSKLARAGEGMLADPALADTLADEAERCFERACAGGEASACFGLGRHRLAHGLGRLEPAVQQPFRRAAALHREGCGAGDPHACYHLADFLLLGLIFEADPCRAEALYERACDAGEPRACQQLERDVIRCAEPRP